MTATGQCPTCGGDCRISECESLAAAEERAQAAGFDDFDDEPCEHEHDEWCEDYQGFSVCSHSHCWNCGGCGCPGYCDEARDEAAAHVRATGHDVIVSQVSEEHLRGMAIR